MPYRYAVLWELADSVQPVGLVLQRDSDVLVELPKALGFPRVYNLDYRVLQPDLSEIVYRPGDEGYFDQVLIELQRHFAIMGQDVASSCDGATTLALLQDHVLSPRTMRRRAEYSVTLTADSADLFVQACLASSRQLPLADSLAHGEETGSTRRRVLQAA